jgi:hypothetical protein
LALLALRDLLVRKALQAPQVLQALPAHKAFRVCKVTAAPKVFKALLELLAHKV